MLDLQTTSSPDNEKIKNVEVLYGHSQSEISENLKNYNIPLKQNSMRTKQLWNWMFLRGISDFSVIKNMPKDLLHQLSSDYTLKRNSISVEKKSNDGTIKWLLELSNNGLSTTNEIETVFIPEEKRGTLCISSQIGCTLNCSFCHTGTQKLIRNLTTEEIISQLLIAKDKLNDWHGNNPNNTRKITNIVMYLNLFKKYQFIINL